MLTVLTAIRRIRGLRMIDVSQQTGLHPATLVNLERGQIPRWRIVRERAQQQLALLFGTNLPIQSWVQEVTAERLLGGTSN